MFVKNEKRTFLKILNPSKKMCGFFLLNEKQSTDIAFSYHLSVFSSSTVNSSFISNRQKSLGVQRPYILWRLLTVFILLLATLKSNSKSTMEPRWQSYNSWTLCVHFHTAEYELCAWLNNNRNSISISICHKRPHLSV